MTIDLALLGSALLLGFVGSTHCVGMCGGISATLGAVGGANNAILALSYNCGRVLCYMLLGLIVGGSVELITIPIAPAIPQIGLWLRSLAGVFAVALGLHVAGRWRGFTRIEALGKYLWRHVQPITGTLLPPRHAGSALLLGGLWGLLPCSMVYSSLGWAAANGTAIGGAEWMVAFGIGTLPAMLITTQGGGYIRGLIRRPFMRRLAALMLIIFGISTAVLPWLHEVHAGHEHLHHSAMP